MKPWEDALAQFTFKWRSFPEVKSIIATGSHVIGTATQHSDLDIVVVLDTGIGWREVGTTRINDTLVEYVANPLDTYEIRVEEERRANKRTTARMLSLGQVSWEADTEGTVLVDRATGWLARAFDPQTPDKTGLDGYYLWEGMDCIEDAAARDDPSVQYLVRRQVALLLKSYCLLRNAEIPPGSKLFRYFVDQEFRRRYHMDEFPDPVFASMFLGCLRDERLLDNVRSMTNYVLQKMDALNIDDWRLRTPAR